MKLNEMNIVITGANGILAAVLMDYFSSRAAFVAGTVRQLADSVENYNNSVFIGLLQDEPSPPQTLQPSISLLNPLHIPQSSEIAVPLYEPLQSKLNSILILFIVVFSSLILYGKVIFC